MISKLARRPSPADHRARFLKRNIAKSIYKCTVKANITRYMKTELANIQKIIFNSSKYSLTTPIIYLVKQVSNFNDYSDTCLKAVGSQVSVLQFWWHLEFAYAVNHWR